MLIYLSTIEVPDDREKFEWLYQQYRYLMLHVAKKLLGQQQDAEDAVHQAFVAILQNLEKFFPYDSPKQRSLIVIIVKRKAIDLLRKRKRDNWGPLDEAVLALPAPETGDHALADAMARLPASYREVLLMRYDNGLTAREIGKLLGITESGVRKTIARAKRALQAELEKEGIVL